MTTIFNYLSFIFLLGLMVSCDPYSDRNGDLLHGVKNVPIINNNGTTTSKLLLQMSSHLKYEDTGTFEDTNIIFGYGTGNKLISYSEVGSSDKFNIEYNSSNKISRVYQTGALNAVYEYSGNNVSKITTTITGVSTSVTSYNYSGDKIVKSIIISYYNFPTPIKTYFEDNYEYSGENIVKNVTKVGVYNPTTGNLEIDPNPTTSLYQYDTKNSPYTLLPKEFWLFFSSVSPRTGFFLSKNNALKSNITQQNGTVREMNAVNVYDTENYLTKSSSGEEYSIFLYK